MKLVSKSSIALLACLMIILAGCQNLFDTDDEKIAHDMAETFKAAYEQALSKSEDDPDLADFDDTVSAALANYEALRPAARGLLAEEKAKLDRLAAKIRAIKEAAYTFYIAPDGLDTNDGSFEHPFATINKAETLVPPGGIVYLRGGVYHITEADIGDAASNAQYAYVFPIRNSGRPGSPITYAAYQGDEARPVFDMTEVTPEGKRVCVFLVEGSWRRFTGFDITGTQVTITDHTQSECIRNRGSNNIYENLAMHDGMAIGFYLQSGANNLVLNCDAYNNWDSVSEGGSGENTDGFGAHIDSGGTGNVFRGCRAWYNADDGYDLIGSMAAVTFDNCWSFYNGYRPNTTVRAANGTGFKSGGYGMNPGEAASNFPNPVPRHTVQFCLAAYNGNIGFYANHHLGGINWYNNTAYQNAANFNMTNRKSVAEVVDVPGYGHELINNLSYAPRSSGRDISNIDDEKCTRLNNSFDTDAVLVDGDFVSVYDWTELRSPRKADGSLPDINFLKPAAQGQLIDRGRNIGFAYAGAAPEWGSRENQAGRSFVPVSGIRLDQAALALSGAQRRIMNAVISPANASNTAVRWSSSNSAVAAVAPNGLGAEVSGVQAGSAVITVTSEDGGFTAQCTVTVGAISVSAVSLNHASIAINSGETGSLSALITPADAINQAVHFESSAPAVATVSWTGLHATVTGVSLGSATITVTTVDGEFTASCAVTVAAPVGVSAVSLNKTSLLLLPGATGSLTATVTPENAVNRNVSWGSSNTGAVTVSGSGSSVTLTAVSAGTASITVTTEDGGFTASCTVTVAAPKLLIRNQAASPQVGTTANNDSFITLSGGSGSWTWTGSQTVVNAETTSLGSTGVGNTTMVYVNVPMTSPYTFTAKITMSGVSTSSSNGILFGELANPADTGAAGFVNFVGMRHLSSNAFRGYYCNTANTFTTGNPNASLAKDSEYTYEIKWDGTAYSWKIESNSGQAAASSTGAVFQGRTASYHPGIIVIKETISITGVTLTLP